MDKFHGNFPPGSRTASRGRPLPQFQSQCVFAIFGCEPSRLRDPHAAPVSKANLLVEGESLAELFIGDVKDIVSRCRGTSETGVSQRDGRIVGDMVRFVATDAWWRGG